MPEIKSKKIKFYIVPLPISNKGLYWTDYANSYISQYYTENYLDTSFIIMTVFLHKNLEINFNKLAILSFELKLEEQQFVYDTFLKHLPYNYTWNGNDKTVMEINYKKKSIKNKKLVIKTDSNYPYIYINSYIIIKKSQTLIDLGGPYKSKEFDKFDKIREKCKFIDYEYGHNDFEINLYGVKDINLVKTFFKKIKTNKILRFGSIEIKIKNLSFHLYMTDDDMMKNKYIEL